MRIAICDDDEWELDHLSKLIMEYQLNRGVKLDCRPFHNVTDFLHEMKGGEYDLIFLDVLMPGISGVEAAQELKELDKNVKLVFVSASPDFALESYNVGAYYYLLKPTGADSLFPLLDKVVDELPRQEEQSFILKNRKGIIRIFFTELEYVEVINKKVFFHLSGDVVYETTAALAEFEGKFLERQDFLKIHRSYLVNLSHILSIESNCVVMRSGDKVPISRQRRSQVKDAYVRFLHQVKTLYSSPDGQAGISGERERSGGAWRILLVDDDASERTFWAGILQSHGCIVLPAGNGSEALKVAEKDSCDCVLLDVKIPGEDGFAICEKLCGLVHAPIIFLSCVTEQDRQVEGFAVGGADYITKDTSADLFWAKVETRIKLAACDRTQLCFGALLLDLAGRRVLVDGKEVFLTSVEFDILWRLSKQAGHIFTPEEIFHIIWEEQPWDGGQTVQAHMSRLRCKLEKAWEGHHFIETVWGQGYRFVPETD